MNRTIKFRAWHEKYKKMLEVHSINFATNEVRTYECVGIKEKAIANVFTLLNNIPYHDKVLLMQYTGLKDKNGVEIYESDIVCNTTNLIVEYGEINQRGYYYLGFYLREIETNNIISLNGISTFRVIGNIYQNKDLLK